MQTAIYILPELFLSFATMLLLMIGVFVKKSFKLVNLLTTFVIIFSTVLVINQPNEIVKIFNESYIIDQFSIIMKVLVLLFSLFGNQITSISESYCDIRYSDSNFALNKICGELPSCLTAEYIGEQDCD